MQKVPLLSAIPAEGRLAGRGFGCLIAMYFGVTVVMGYIAAFKMQRFARWHVGALEAGVKELRHLHHSAPNVFTYAILH